MEVALERQRRKNMERELAKLMRKRDGAIVGSTAYQLLNKQVNELKAQLCGFRNRFRKPQSQFRKGSCPTWLGRYR